MAAAAWEGGLTYVPPRPSVVVMRVAPSRVLSHRNAVSWVYRMQMNERPDSKSRASPHGHSGLLYKVQERDVLKSIVSYACAAR